MRFPARIKRNVDFLKLLTSSKPAGRRTLIQQATKDQVDALCEIVLNLLRGNLAVTPQQLQGMQRFAKRLRALVRRRQSVKSKKALVTQGGRGGVGVLKALAGVLVPMALEYFGTKIYRRYKKSAASDD